MFGSRSAVSVRALADAAAARPATNSVPAHSVAPAAPILLMIGFLHVVPFLAAGSVPPAGPISSVRYGPIHRTIYADPTRPVKLPLPNRKRPRHQIQTAANRMALSPCGLVTAEYAEGRGGKTKPDHVDFKQKEREEISKYQFPIINNDGPLPDHVPRATNHEFKTTKDADYAKNDVPPQSSQRTPRWAGWA